ncbi:hypothetical protein DL95DRAFT_382933 [Leptodontidium sp. 2 PMI_412]|nr:hypothetical protein DL95DRAFT_382933 [Leptodontidium sp. 2 PMI_412]
MASSTEPTTNQSTQTTPTTATPTPTPKLTRIPMLKKTPQQIRESSSSIALSCLLGLLFFSLVIHACVRSVATREPWRGKGPKPNDSAIVGAIFSFIPIVGTIVGIVTYLEEVSPGLGGQTVVNSMFAAVVGLAWVVFGVGQEAEFRIYLAWVMWPVVGAFGVMVLGAWVGVLGCGVEVKDEGKGKERKKE